MDPKAPCASLSNKLRILVAVRHRDFASALSAMLRGLGINAVAAAHDSQTACLLLKSTRFDAMILDADLGPDGGIKLTRRMRTQPDCPNATLPVVMISAAADKGFIVKARDAGIHEFIRMPVSADILRARLCSALLEPREFVAARDYAGPDRRRHKNAYVGPERRARNAGT